MTKYTCIGCNAELPTNEAKLKRKLEKQLRSKVLCKHCFTTSTFKLENETIVKCKLPKVHHEIEGSVKCDCGSVYTFNKRNMKRVIWGSKDQSSSVVCKCNSLLKIGYSSREFYILKKKNRAVMDCKNHFPKHVFNSFTGCLITGEGLSFEMRNDKVIKKRYKK